MVSRSYMEFKPKILLDRDTLTRRIRENRLGSELLMSGLNREGKALAAESGPGLNITTPAGGKS